MSAGRLPVFASLFLLACAVPLCAPRPDVPEAALSQQVMLRSSSPVSSLQPHTLGGEWIWVAVTESGLTWSGKMVLGRALEQGKVQGQWGRSSWCVPPSRCRYGTQAGWLGSRDGQLEAAQLVGSEAQFWALDQDGRLELDRRSGRLTFLGTGRWNYSAGGSTEITFGMSRLQAAPLGQRIADPEPQVVAWLARARSAAPRTELSLTEFKVRETLRQQLADQTLAQGG